MSPTNAPDHQASHSARALVWAGLPILLILGLVRSPFAQSAPGGYGPGSGPGMGRMRGGNRMGAPGSEHRTQIGQAIEGPLAPAVMQDSAGLSGKGLEEYTRRYSTLMTATRPARDSLRNTMKEIRTAFQGGDRASARDRRADVERQSNTLLDQDKKFEKGLKDFLNKDQQKRYQQLLQNREKASREQWQRNRPAGSQDRWTYRADNR